MLKSLSIRDFAILDAVDLVFEPGFTAITGETGAGKSIVTGALKLLLGAKAKSDSIRRGADKLRVEAVFDLPPDPELRAVLQRLELDAEEELTLEREVTAAGKSRSRVNGTLVALGDLEAVGRRLVDLHGQHEQQGLLDAAHHGAYLDGYAGLGDEAAAFGRRYAEARAADQDLRRVEEDAARLREQSEFLRFQFQELDKAGLQAGEEERLESALKMLAGLEKITAGRAACLDALEGPAGALGALGRLERELPALLRHLEPTALAGEAEPVAEANAALSGLRDALRRLDVPEAAEPERLDALNARLALLQRLRSKYKTDLDGLIALHDRRAEEIARMENAGVETAALRDQRETALAAARSAAAALSEKRRQAAQRFDAAVTARLGQLGMEGSRLETRVQALSPEQGFLGLQANGMDAVEFYLAANPGEPSKPLRQSASGGEISRVMLAVKGALAHSDPRPVLVFDELDTGIGGSTALRVGEALAELAAHHQLLVITHLHQVAAQAERHYCVEKHLQGGRTVTRMFPLREKERAAELARMMGGESSEAALRHARELLKKSG